MKIIFYSALVAIVAGAYLAETQATHNNIAIIGVNLQIFGIIALLGIFIYAKLRR